MFGAKSRAFGLSETLVSAGLVDRVGKQGYQSCLKPMFAKRFRLGFASQSNLLPFTQIASDSLMNIADTHLLVLNNQCSSRIALQNAKNSFWENVDPSVDSKNDASMHSAASN